MEILDYIPIGSKNAVRRSYLREVTGLPDRTLRQMIHAARRKIPILNLSDGRGYYIPDMNREADRQALAKWVRQEESRLKSTGWSLYAARRTLSNCNIDGRTYGRRKEREKLQGQGKARGEDAGKSIDCLRLPM